MTEQTRTERSSFWQRVAYLTSIGWLMAVPIAAGVLLGKALDNRYGTGSFWTLALLGAGVTIAILEAAIALQRAQRTTRDD